MGAPIDGVMVSASASQPNGRWLETRRPLIHRPVFKFDRIDASVHRDPPNYHYHYHLCAVLCVFKIRSYSVISLISI